MTLNVYADLRWPDRTGIGLVMRELLARAPMSVNVIDLKVAVSVGSPSSPFVLGAALMRASAKTGVFWTPGFIPPVQCTLPSVVTVHDLTHLKYYSLLHRAYYSFVLKPMYRKVTKIVCVSDYTAKEFVCWSGMAPSNVETIYNGVAESFYWQVPAKLPSYQYVFYPGNRRPYKNLNRLVRAFAASKLPSMGIKIVLTGERDEALSNLASILGISESLQFVGNLDESELIGLYKGALIVAFVSLYEGFGLPVIEGMAAGVPVITSTVSAMPEIAGSAAHLVDPTSITQITDGLNRLACDQDERRRLIDLGKVRARIFSWDSAAARVWPLILSLDPSQSGRSK